MKKYITTEKFRGWLTAKEGFLLGGVKKHLSTLFNSLEDASNWVEQAVDTNEKAGRKVSSYGVESIHLKRLKKNPSKYKHKRLASPKKFAKKSFRTIKNGKKKINRKIKKNPIVTEKFALLGIAPGGSEYFYYTGKAGEGWISKKLSDAFLYDTRESAIRKTIVFNKTTPVHSLNFVATPVHNIRAKNNPKIKTKKETLYFIHAKSKKGMGLNNGLYNSDRNSLTTEFSEATHYHNKKLANDKVSELKNQFRNWNWTVKPTTFFEG